MAFATPEAMTYGDSDSKAWNFKIYALWNAAKDVDKKMRMYIKQLQPMTGIVKANIEHARDYFEITCFITSQKYDCLHVGSMSEGVAIHQIFQNENGEIPNEFYVSYESDVNLCFKDIIAAEIMANESLDPSTIVEPTIPLTLHIMPLAAGHVNLALPRNINYPAIPGLKHLCVLGEHGLTLLSSELLVNEIYQILTIRTAKLNVEKCLILQDETIDETIEEHLIPAKDLQYVGQAGPAVHTVTCIPTEKKNKIHLYLTEDVSLSVPCKTWPSCASKWPLRSRTSGWPSKELTDNVIADGCHLVPKYDPSGGNGDTTARAAQATPMTTWRYSFSLAEKTLMNSITEDQRMCYLVFKYLFARFIKLPSIITTYTAKTLFLRELETVPVDEWCLSEIGIRVKNLVEKLRECIQNNYCEHYFIEACNTLQQMDDEDRKSALEVSFPSLDNEMNEKPDPDTGILELDSDYRINLMTTYKQRYPVNMWLESLTSEANSKHGPPSNIPSEQNISDLLDNTKVCPIEMTKVLIYLVMSDKVFGRPLPIPTSLLKQDKVSQVVQFLKRSTTDDKFKELMKELDVELKFLHLQYKIIDEIEQFQNVSVVSEIDDGQGQGQENQELSTSSPAH